MGGCLPIRQCLPFRHVLWKPVSESNGNCVVLLPSNMTGKVKGVTVRGPNGQAIERGDYSSVANGGREHYRFNKPGGQYPAGCYVEIEMKDGTSQRVPIANPSQRVE